MKKVFLIVLGLVPVDDALAQSLGPVTTICDAFKAKYPSAVMWSLPDYDVRIADGVYIINMLGEWKKPPMNVKLVAPQAYVLYNFDKRRILTIGCWSSGVK